MGLPHLNWLPTLCTLGCLRARLLTELDRGPEAADQFSDLLWLVRQFREEAFLISNVIGISLNRQVLIDLRLALGKLALANVDLQRVRLALEDSQRPSAWPRAIQTELLTLGRSMQNRDIYDDIRKNTLDDDNSSIFMHFLFRFSGSWLGAPLRINDEAACNRVLTRSYLHPWKPMDTLVPSWRYPVTNMLFPHGLQTVRSALDLETERIAAAQLALYAAGGGTPVATSDLGVERGADGSWTISHLPKAGRPDRVQKMLLPWHVPARR
jgi:hypothetical protein